MCGLFSVELVKLKEISPRRPIKKTRKPCNRYKPYYDKAYIPPGSLRKSMKYVTNDGPILRSELVKLKEMVKLKRSIASRSVLGIIQADQSNRSSDEFENEIQAIL